MINKYKEIFVQGTHWNLMFLLFDFAVDIPRFILLKSDTVTRIEYCLLVQVPLYLPLQWYLSPFSCKPTSCFFPHFFLKKTREAMFQVSITVREATVFQTSCTSFWLSLGSPRPFAKHQTLCEE